MRERVAVLRVDRWPIVQPIEEPEHLYIPSADEQVGPISIQDGDVQFIKERWHKTRCYDSNHLKVYVGYVTNLILPLSLHGDIAKWLDTLANERTQRGHPTV